MDIPQDTKDAIHTAIERLAGVCDHAQSRDAVGFSASTASVGHELATLPRHYWLPAIYALAASTATHHRGQLERDNTMPAAELDKVASIAELQTASREDVPSDWADYRAADDTIVFSLGAKRGKTTKLLKRIPDAYQPAGGGRVWCVPGKYAFALTPIFPAMTCEPGVKERIEQSLATSTREDQIQFIDKLIDTNGETFTVRSPYDEALVASLKSIKGSSWFNNLWNLPASASSGKLVADLAEDDGFTLTESAKALVRHSEDILQAPDLVVDDTGTTVTLAFKYNPLWVGAIKELPHGVRRFDSITKTWAVDRDSETLDTLIFNLAGCGRMPDESSMKALESLRDELAPATAAP